MSATPSETIPPTTDLSAALSQEPTAAADTDRPHTPLTYMRQLDGLRTLAVGLVLAQHFLWIDNEATDVLTWGRVGVRLFFVLSGFLITGILLKCRRRKDAERSRAGLEMRNFYIRRSLRIFPVYYATLLAAVATSSFVRARSFWFFFYLQNIEAAWLGHFQTMSHFWSLAVEEQFYFVWPWLILFLPARLLLPCLLAMIALGPISRGLANAADFNNFAASMLPTSCLDTLGGGALLAFWSQSRPLRERFPGLPRWALAIGAVTIAISFASYYAEANRELLILTDIGLAGICMWVVHRAAQGFGGIVGRALSAGPVVYIGRISYGIYVFHEFVPHQLTKLGDRFGFELRRGSIGGLVVFSLVTLLVAALSWQFFEKPINRLKERFQYDG